MPAMAVLVVVLLARPIRAQGPADAGAAQPSGEIDIACDSFGVGGTARVGELVGLRLGLQDSAERPREVLVRVSVRDGDGDFTLYQDAVATNPGFRQPVWVYFHLPFWFNSSSVLTVTAHAALEVDPAPPDPALPRYSAGRLVGIVRLPPQQLVSSQVGMYGVIGRSALGLAPYEGDTRLDHLVSGHERTEVVTAIELAKLPDRWMGLAQFDMIAWGAGQPGTLGPEAAHALREWVVRGGHLVVVVPRVGETWSDPGTNPLHDITPPVRFERREGVDLGPFEPIIRWPARGAAPLPVKESLHVFSPATEGGWGEGVYPILHAPDGACIAVRRLHGAGAVTLIGLDLNAAFFTNARLPEPELFWHRILGRRCMVMSPTDFDSGPTERRVIVAPTGRDAVTLDRDVGSLIDRKGQAAAGVLIGFVVFVAYWLVAGPLGFLVLKRSGHGRHAWVAFLAAAGVFTAIAWGGAAAIRPSRVQGFHLTFLDHVYGQGWQRARAWVNVLTPVYGEAGISIGDPQRRADPIAPADRVYNAIAPWEPPGSGVGGGFPDSRGYAVECKLPENIRFPARSTVKQFQIEWSGGPRWEMPTPQGADGPGTLDLLPSGQGKPVLRGVLKHGLPGPLRDVTLIVVRGQRVLSPSLANPLTQQDTILANVVVVSRGASEWAPGDAWDLAGIVQEKPDGGNDLDSARFLSDLLGARSPDDQIGGAAQDRNVAARLTAVSLYSQLGPPDLSDRTMRTSQNLALRRLTHGWDLGRWFTQPCVIVIGFLGTDDRPQPSPISLWVDAGGGYRAAPTTGRTVVRWVYPLPADPPDWPAPRAPEEPAAEPGGGG